jgi:hypothetical protein
LNWQSNGQSREPDHDEDLAADAIVRGKTAPLTNV